MAFALITLTASLILNLAVLMLLKIGLRDGQRADLRSGPPSGNWAGHQPC